MIVFLTGILVAKESNKAIIDVNGIGYEAFCTVPHLNKLILNEKLTLVTYHHIKEDTQQLYGFENNETKEFFETLISISGIGPKVGLTILASITIPDFVQAIQTKNIVLITQCPGIGKKTAERIIVELKDKVNHLLVNATDIQSQHIAPDLSESDTNDDIVQALSQLGYKKEEIKRGFIKHAKELAMESSIENQIKILLKYL